MFLSRLTATVATRARNLFPHEASEKMLAAVEGVVAGRRPLRASDRVVVGTGERALSMSRLAVGTGSDGWFGASAQTRQLGVEGLADLLMHAYEEHDVNVWDSADQYGSHPHVARALQRVEREKVVVLTKTCATTAADMRRELDRFRSELGTDYIDILLLHCMTKPKWPAEMGGVMDVISEAQAAGTVRVKGVSCHSLSALKAAAAEPWVELDLARINLGGQNMDSSPGTVVPILQTMKERGKAVMGMKIFGAGTLVDRRPACLRFVLGLDCVDTFTIGFESRRQLDETVSMIAAV